MIVTDESNQSSQVDHADGIVLQGNQSTTPIPPTSSHSGSTEGSTSHNVAGSSSSTSQVVLDDIASSTSSPPCQPVGITFPVTYI